MIQLESECINRSSKTQEQSQNSFISSNNRSQFQKRFKIHQLQSQVNQVSIQLQKTSLKFQHQLKQQKNYLQKLKAQKHYIATKYHSLNEEFYKVKLLLEAEKQSKKTYSQKYKEIAQIIPHFNKILEKQDLGVQSIIRQIESVIKINQSNKRMVQELSLKLKTVKNQYEYEVRLIQKNRQNKQSQLRQQFVSKTTKLQSQNQQLSQLNIRNQVQLNELTLNVTTLQKCKKESAQKLQNLQNYKNQLTKKCQQIEKLKVKLQMFDINKNTLKDQRYKFDEETEQLRFKLQISQKKIDYCQNRLRQVESKNIRLQESISVFKQKQREMSEKYIEITEQNNEINKTMHIWQIYRQKYKQKKIQSKQIGQRADHYQTISQQYAYEIHHLQLQIKNKTQTIDILEKDQFQRKEQLQSKTKDLLKLSLINNHQIQLIKQKNEQIKKLRGEMDEQMNKLNVIINNNAEMQMKYAKINNQNSINMQNKPTLSRQQPSHKELNELVKHYQQILKHQEQNSINLQQKLTQHQTIHLKYKLDIIQLQSVITELKQENIIIKGKQNQFNSLREQQQREFQNKLKKIKQRLEEAKMIQLEIQRKTVKRLRISKQFSCKLDPNFNFHSYQATSFSIKKSSPNKDYDNYDSKLFRYRSSQQLINITQSPSHYNHSKGNLSTHTLNKVKNQQKQSIDLSLKKKEFRSKTEVQNIQAVNRLISSNKALQEEIISHKHSKQTIKRLLNIYA